MRYVLALSMAVITAALLMGCIILPIEKTEVHHHHYYSSDPPANRQAVEAQAEAQAVQFTLEVTDQSDCDD